MPIMPTGDFILREQAVSRLAADERMVALIQRGGKERGLSDKRIAELVKPYNDDAAMMRETLA